MEPLSESEVEALREKHQQCGGSVVSYCVICGPWPCPTARLLAERERLLRVVEAAREFLPTFYYPLGQVNEHGQEEPRAIAYRALRNALAALEAKG